MKTIGLIGGMSWESTIPYYRHINETIKQQLGSLHSARIILYGAQAIILGCTEISLLVSQTDSSVPLFDTTAIHARAAALKALQD